MQHKTKFLFAGVAVFAIVLVWQGAKALHSAAMNGPVYAGTQDLTGPDDDPDHDGLTNEQEALWGTDPNNPDTDGDGFLDGEEVATGHNPLIPGPDDLLNAGNLTEQLSELTIDGLAAGDLKPDSDDYDQSLADVSSSLDDSNQYIFNTAIDPTVIKVVDDNRTTDAAYAAASVVLVKQFDQALGNQYARLEQDLTTIGNDTGFSSDILNFYSGETTTYETILNNGLTMSVPSAFKDAHVEFLSLVSEAHNISDAIASGDTDPVKAAMAFNALGDMTNSYIQFLTDYNTDFTSQNIDTSTLSIPQQ